MYLVSKTYFGEFSLRRITEAEQDKSVLQEAIVQLQDLFT